MRSVSQRQSGASRSSDAPRLPDRVCRAREPSYRYTVAEGLLLNGTALLIIARVSQAQLIRRYRHTHSGMKIASRPMIQAAAPASDPGTPPSSA